MRTILTLLAVLVIHLLPAYAQDRYRGDYIDEERRLNRKALRQNNCFWFGEDCPGTRRWRHRHYRAPVKVYSNGETDAFCHRLIETTGEQAQSKDNAEAFALRSWQGRVRFHFGEKYLNFENARDKRLTCSPSSVADTVGGKIGEKLLGISHFRCELSARPCRAPARKISKNED